MLNEKEIEQIERYISGEADASNSSFVESLFINGPNNHELLSHLETEWERGNPYDEIPSEMVLNNMLDRVHHLIRNKENQNKKLVVPRLVRAFTKVAAILFLPLVLAGGLTITYLLKSSSSNMEQSANQVIHAPLGSRVSFKLPDGSTGWLNSGSNLTYTLPFNKSRKISLSGEAWFNVTHDQKHPFEINISGSRIKVLGTSFNVSAYQETQYIEVVLQQGKVEFYQDDNSEKVTMEPSQKLIFSNGKVGVGNTDPSKYEAWTEGKLVFRGDNMAEVARRIERWYNVRVILVDRDLDRYSFRATFEDDSLEEVLRLLGKTSPIEFTITPSFMKPDGTIQKEVVSLFKRGNRKINNQK
ncbi:MAG: DUF4974 domain-containing protein [Prolixibacteraceae bacterium]|jgi:ferric-dicitrate binding protein FerR (iron transport regulator)|nr:DUF4974 domain-containing protein [Prolixibacteraceae bacterium]